MTNSEPLVTFIQEEARGAFVTTGPEEGAIGPYERLEVDITRFADRVSALGDERQLEAVGWGGVITDEDVAAVLAATELAAFLTSVFGVSLGPADALAVRLRRLTGMLDSFRDLLNDLREGRL